MIKFIDDFLNKITMYRLVLYFLIALIILASILSLLGILSYNPLLILFSAGFITLICLIANKIFSSVFEAPTNVESAYITAFILALIITPPTVLADASYLWLALWASVWAMASKYIFAIGKKHLFNPAAFAVALTAIAINQPASWWVGTPALLPLVLIGGILVTRKIRRTDLVLGFLAAASVVVIGGHLSHGNNIITTAQQFFIYSPLLFFATVMLTEPLTAPPDRFLRIAYGALVGVLFLPSLHIGSLYSTPELALLAGNIFSYIVSPKQKLMLRLKKKIRVAADVYNFVLEPDHRLAFQAGQYLEWTVPHAKPDSRGNRRYFTIASAPSESDIVMGVKFYPKGSSFKWTLAKMKEGDVLAAGALAGDFVLPKNKSKKLAFIAGGIGITPFRSMISELLYRREKRDIALFYSNKTPDDVAYKDLFDQAGRSFGMKTFYVITDANTALPLWISYTGYIDKSLIMKTMPDWRERVFYLSGPHGMVAAFNATLQSMGVPRGHIKKDFFPGFV